LEIDKHITKLLNLKSKYRIFY